MVREERAAEEHASVVVVSPLPPEPSQGGTGSATMATERERET